MIQTIDPNEREDRNLAVLAHLSAIIGGFVVPFGNIAGPLIMYFSYRDKKPFAAEHAKASLNFQITMTIVAVLLIIVALVVYGVLLVTVVAGSSNSDKPTPLSTTALIGIFALIIACVAFFVWTLFQNILGAVAASKGRIYKYPLAREFVK
jgi:uncharacterized Tic20 family protein